MKNFGNIILGVVLILVGLVVGLNVLGITDINIFFDGWWTLFIIVPCLVGLFKDREKTGSIIGLLIGIVLFLCCQDIIDFEKAWQLILPIILVVIGLSIIFKDALNGKIKEEIKRINEKNKKEDGYCATFSEQKLNFDDEKFNGTDLTAVFGGIKCDLRKAKIDKDVVINASSIFGGIDIYVPEGVKVKIKSSSIFGGVDEKRKNKDTNEKAHTIYVNANCVFGGVDIK